MHAAPPDWAGSYLSCGNVHDLVAHRKEFGGSQALCEEVGQVVACAYIRYHDLSAFYALANVEVSTLDVFHSLVVFGVVSGVARRFVVASLRSGA